jgi:hypothetical protein
MTSFDERAFLVLGTIWVVAGWSSFLFFHFNKNARLKRKLFPKLTIALGILMVAAISVPLMVTGRVVWAPAFYGPVVALFVLRTLRGTRFCDACGATIGPVGWFDAPRFCPRCGASLENEHRRKDVPPP